MSETEKTRHSRLIAAWPGLGNVAFNAGVYLLAKLNMSLISELTVNELFDIEHVEVKEGILRLGRRPRNRFFVWRDPKEKHDLVIFLGEAQPPMGKYPFCRQLLDYASVLGVDEVVTFAAMATRMRPEGRSRVFVAATDQECLSQWTRESMEMLKDGDIGGLNGILLGVAKERGLKGACLLGEMPRVFGQLPFPKASLAILTAFTALTGIAIDLVELTEQADAMERQLGELLSQLEQAYGKALTGDEDQEEFQPQSPEDRLTASDRRTIEQLFADATQDRSKAFELKRQLDRLGVFQDYEDRFLDLFRKPEPE